MIWLVLIFAVIGYAIYSEKSKENKQIQDQKNKVKELNNMFQNKLDYEKKYTTYIKNKQSNNDLNKSLSNNTFEQQYKKYITEENRTSNGLISYVKIKFDHYDRVYTYLAPSNKCLVAGSKIKVKTNDGIKNATVIKGNYKDVVKTDLDYKVIEIIE